MSKCKLHGYPENCPQCSANFWEQESQDMRNILFDISYAITEQIPDGEVIENIQKILKESGLIDV